MSEGKIYQPTQVFVSHTKLDSDFCDRFDIAASREGVKVFRSELEDVGNPPWITIRDAINASSALFLLVGNRLVEMQAKSETELESKDKWKFTQNWIAFEIGLACHRGIDIWVWCENANINFPVPYLNNYVVDSINKSNLKFVRSIFCGYKRNNPYPLHRYQSPDRTYECPSCGAAFNFHSPVHEGHKVTCPACLTDIEFSKGWLLDAK